MTKQEEITRASKERGYVVNNEGLVFNGMGKQLSIGKSSKGYLSFNIRLDKESNPTRSFVHRLQAFQKFGDEIFKDGIVVRHLNGISTDNSYGNIGIGTCSENSLDIPKEKRIINASNPIHNHEDIINDRKNGYSYKELMDKYSITSKGTISFIINKSLKNKE